MKAHERLSDESKWTKGANARTTNGNEIDERNPGAFCFCLEGVINHVYGLWSDEFDLLKNAEELRGIAPHMWNDAPERTFAEVHDLLVKLDI